LSGRHTASPVERIPGYPELVSFARQTDIVSAGQAASLLRRAVRNGKAASRGHGRALLLREALYRTFAAVARQETPALEDLAKLDRELGRLCIGVDLSLAWREEPEALDGFVGAIVHAAVLLLTEPAQRDRVRLCEAPDCLWLFYDTSRNRSRRWCDMRQCGNRMKARRHYARGKGGHQN
jgi:predicted RNA-binding Zn ribbon-like protein